MSNRIQSPEARAMLDAAGLTPAKIRAMTGVSANTTSAWWRDGIPTYVQTIIDQYARITQLVDALSEIADLYESALIANGLKPEMAALHTKRFRGVAPLSEKPQIDATPARKNPVATPARKNPG